MFKKLLTNPVTGKIIQKTNTESLSIIINDFYPKLKKPRKVIKKPKMIIENITDDEYFFLNGVSNL